MKDFHNEDTLKEHLKNYHNINSISKYLQEIVYGGSDGIVTVLAVVSGFAGAERGGAQLPISIVVLFGLSNLFGDAVSMGLGNFLSLRSEKAVIKRHFEKQTEQIREDSANDFKQTIFLLMRKGYTYNQANDIARAMGTNIYHLVEFTLEAEIGESQPSDEHPAISGLITALSFIIFGCIPLVPYFFGVFEGGYNYSVGLGFVSMVVLGLLRSYVTKEKLFKAVFETVLVAGIASLISYFIGSLFVI